MVLQGQDAASISQNGRMGRYGGSEWGSNPPVTGNLPPAGFEDRDQHRLTSASVLCFQ